jgi:eukaryotic-like serine/threonine-protein kinase
VTPWPDAPLSGRQIGNYRLEREIGRGGMGVVYLATHVALERSVALKLLLPELAQDASVVARMLQEARCAAQITGHHVVRVIDVGQLEHTGQPFIVMEYVAGVDLARWLEREGPPPPERAVRWVIEACVAIAEAHEKGIVHRDLKPENLLLAEEEGGAQRIKVLDFGISKQLHRTGLRAVTRPHDLMGSPRYMAPEQILTPLLVDARADLWALGTILVELLTGEAAFPGQTAMEVWAGVLEAAPYLPEERVETTWPAGLVGVVRKALQKAPEERFQSVHELVTALAPYAPADAQPALAAIQRRVARASGAASLVEPPIAEPSLAPPLPAAAPAPWRRWRALLGLLAAAGLLAATLGLRACPTGKLALNAGPA